MPSHSRTRGCGDIHHVCGYCDYMVRDKTGEKAEARVYRALYALLWGLDILLKKAALRSSDQGSEIIGFVFRFWSG